jgi:hypothetical protein
MEFELHSGVEWAPHVREFYAEWLQTAGLKPDSRRSFDRFVSLMEERMGDYLMDQCRDFSGMGLVRQEADDVPHV